MFWHGESVAKRSEFYCAGQQFRHICGRRGYVVDHDTCVGYASLRRTPRHQNGGRFDLWNGCQPSSEISYDKPYQPYLHLHRCRFFIRKMRPKLGRISFSQGGAFMPKDRRKSQKTVSTKEYKIGGTRYVVTAYFKSQGSTAIDHIKRMIDNATQNNICRKY